MDRWCIISDIWSGGALVRNGDTSKLGFVCVICGGVLWSEREYTS
jgi:hypothetical protein